MFLPLFSELSSQFVSPLEPYTAFSVNMDICRAFFKRHLLKGQYKNIPPCLPLRNKHPRVLYTAQEIAYP